MAGQAVEGLVIFGTSNIISEVIDCGLAIRLPVLQIVLHEPVPDDAGSLPLAQRLAGLAAHGICPGIVSLDHLS